MWIYMKLKKITLNNFGIYRGQHEYDFSVTPEKNLILISGKNGAGKTTLLNALKLCLYGPMFLGYQGYSNQYYAFVDSKLNEYAKKEIAQTYSISLAFDLVEDQAIKNYEIKRNWHYNSRGKLKEELSVHKDSMRISSKQALEFFQYLQKLMPPSLFDIYFFDGEKIEKLFLLKNGTEDLMGIFESLYNLDLFSQLQSDLTNYIHRKTVYNTLDENQKKYSDLITTKQSLLDQIKDNDSEIEQIEKVIRDTEIDLEEKEKLHHVLGGLKNEETARLREELQHINFVKEEKVMQTKEFVHELLPFFLLKEELNQLSKSLFDEKEYRDQMTVSNALKGQDLAKQLEISLDAHDVDTTPQVIETILQLLSDEFMPTMKSSFQYNISSEDEHFIHELTRKLNHPDYPEGYLQSHYELIHNQNKRISEINKKLEENIVKMETLS